MKMQSVLKIEELLMFLLSIYLFQTLDYAWWWFPALLLAPDLSILGYAVNPRIGAAAYNFFHHKGVAVATFLIGVYLAVPLLQLAGIILFAHSSMDRIFGYGLKYPDHFKHTHLGWIGKKE